MKHGRGITPRAMSWRPFVAIALVLINIMTMPINTAWSEQGFWTRQDLEKVADAAASAAAAASSATSHSFMLLNLADALIRAGNAERAKPIVLQAGTVLGPGNDFMHSSLASRVVETLARLGDMLDAEALADAVTDDDTHATLLGRIGQAQARAGDIAGTLRTVERIGPLPEVTQKPVPAAANAKILALAGIGGALNDRGETGIVLKMAEGFPNGYQKINLLSRIGKRLCASGEPAQVAKGRLVAEQAAKAASIATERELMPYEKRNWVVAAAGALGTCAGPDVAIRFVQGTLPAQQIIMASSLIADNFVQTGEASLAQAMAPAVDPDDLDSLLDSAKRSLRLGDQEAAKAMATQASATASKLYRVRLPPDKFPAVSEICGLLIKLRSYDAAVESTLPIDPINRAQFYVSVVQGEINDKDAGAVAKTVPTAIEALKAPASQPILIRMTLVLAQGRYEAEAKLAYEALVAARNVALTADPRQRGPDAFIGVQAVMGDLPGALAEADRAGPLAAKPNGLMATVMSFANATTAPTKAEVETRLRQIQGTLPPFGAGPKATMLTLIASDLAFAGHIDAAWQVEGGLEGEARDVLQSNRDNILVAIAEAQERANDPEGSLATALRIEQPLVRLNPLLRLAAIPPGP